MKRSLAIVVALASAALLMAVVSSPALGAFGFTTFDMTYTKEDLSPATQAGSHPFAVTNTLDVNTTVGPEGNGCIHPECEFPDGEARNIEVEFPPGFIGNPLATPRCSAKAFSEENIDLKIPSCPDSSAVGMVAVKAEFDPFEVGTSGVFVHVPVYNLQPPPGVAAKLGFWVVGVPITVESGVSEAEPFNLKGTLTSTSQALLFYGSELILWGEPSNPIHDQFRGSCLDALPVNGALISLGNCPYTGQQVPFLTLPRSCQGPQVSHLMATSWQEPNNPVPGVSTSALETNGCESLGFSPTIDAKPSESHAESPTGLDFDLNVNDPGLLENGKVADSDIEKAVVTLPEGVTTNPSIASGLSACSLDQYRAEAAKFDPTKGCPDSSKVGSVEVTTPLLEEPLQGSVYIARQRENPFNSLLALYVVIRSEKYGIVVRQAGKVEPDSRTGQLKTTFAGIPQLPFSRFHFHFREGPRAPLITPAVCGTYEINADLYPYANPGVPLHRTATFTVNSGAGGAACANSSSQLPNAPSFSAGTLSPKAGTYSPFVLKLSRADGTQQFSSITTSLPKGLIGKLAGIPYCSDAQIAQAQARSGEGEGAVEIASPSCPVASEVGTVTVGSGAGPTPYYVTGHAYLAGPYKGAPLSLEIITPAIAGPFDLGTVAVRTALNVDLTTAQITAVSDPIPSILHGLPLDVRSIAINMSRPNFMLNPSGCEPKSITGSVTSLLGSSAQLSQYFQASNCTALKFKPKLSLQLKGKTKRSGHPALKAVLNYPKGGAYSNVARAQVGLPHSEFLDQGNLDKVCTQPELKSATCPKSSIYGHAKAWTPLLDKPLQGPVYIGVGFGYKLPALVADLNGQIRVLLVGKIDTNSREGIRNTFEATPDAPVSKFVLEMKGGKKYGLLENSENICRKPQRAATRFIAQNGLIQQTQTPIKNDCGKSKKKSHKKGKKASNQGHRKHGKH